MSYIVRVGYDAQEHVYLVLSSDIPGLHIETGSFEEFVETTIDAAPDLVGAQAIGSSVTYQREVTLADV